MICTFTLSVLHIMWQMKQYKVNNAKFFIRNVFNVLQKSLKLSDDES